MSIKKTLAESMTIKYVSALVLLALLTATSYFIFRQKILADETSAAVINISGRQRMLSQRIATFSLLREVETDLTKKEEMRKILMEAVDLMEKSHIGLLKGDPTMNLPGNPSEQVRAIYFEHPLFLDKKVRKFLADAKTIASLPHSEDAMGNPEMKNILSLARAELLNSLDMVVNQYQLESEASVSSLQSLEDKVLGFSLIVLLSVGVCIFRPMVRRASQENLFVVMLQKVTRAANEAETIEEVAQISLDEICEHTKWIVGHLYILPEKSSDKLVSTTVWHLKDCNWAREFKEITGQMDFPSGVGLPGRVLADGKPVRISDVTKDPNFPRIKLIEETGIWGGFAFPILIGKRVVGVMEFFSDQTSKPDERFSDVMFHIGTQMGRVIERQEAEERMELAQKQLMASKKLAGIGELTAGVSHEVLNPVNIISVQTQMLQRKTKDDPKIQKFCNKVRHEIDRIQKIMSSLLAFSRSGDSELQSGNLRDSIESVLALVEAEYKLDNIKIVRDWCDSLVEISYDPDKIRQVYLNLLHNAKHAMPDGGTITVGCASANNGGKDYHQFTFSDTGTGMSEEVRLKIFEPFFTTKPEGQGTGMGLSVIHGIIEEHGGKIRVESEEGKGTTFTISLPVAN